MQQVADAPGEVKTGWKEAEHTLTKAGGSPQHALSHSCCGCVPALLGFWGEGRAGLEGSSMWAHLCVLRRTAGIQLPAAVVGAGFHTPGGLLPASWQRAPVAGKVSCLGMAQLNVQPPISVE